MTKNKLYHKTSSTFELPHYVDMKNQVYTKEAENIPMMTWPDGTWCLPANVYMLKLYEKGLSRKFGGGTLLTYATNISHLLRYVYFNKIQLCDLSDNQFTLFIRMLQGEKRERHPEVTLRDSNSVIAIGRNCLEFLEALGHLYQIDNFVGPKGQIKGEKRDFAISANSYGKGKGKIIRKYWDHRIFPSPSPKNRRLPISTDNVKRLRQATTTTSASIYLRKRRNVMLKLLEITGGRRSEVAEITCDSILVASYMKDPLLSLVTVKKGGNILGSRSIPISKHDIAYLLEFININRRRTIRLTCGREKDDGYLLVSERTGKGLRPNTITQEVAILAKAAGVVEKSCPHMFRHRFITKLFVALIEQHEFINVDSFRKALLDTESLKQKIQQYTGHTNLSSLDIYIDLAFEEITNFKKTLDIVSTKMVVSSFQGTINQLYDELINGGSTAEITLRLTQLLTAFDDDLNKCQSPLN